MKRKDFSLPIILTIISFTIILTLIITFVMGFLFFFDLSKPPDLYVIILLFSGLLFYFSFGISAIILSFFKRHRSRYNKYFFLGHILLLCLLTLTFVEPKYILRNTIFIKEERLFSAVSPLNEKYSLKKVESLLQSGSNVNRRHKNGYSVLMSAVKRCDPKLIEVLVKAGADVNARTEKGRTPLTYACKLEETDYNGKYFSEKKQAEVVRILIEAGAEINKGEYYDRPIIIAAGHNKPLVVKELIKAGADFNVEFEHLGRTVLHEDDLTLGIAKELINAGASIYAIDDFGYSPVDIARYRHDITDNKLMELLLYYEKIKYDNALRSLTDSRWYVRRNAAEELGREKDKRAAEPLIAALEDEHWWVRSSAAEALGRIGDKKAVTSLIGTLKDTDWAVRYYAAVALGKLGDRKAVKPILDAFNDNDETEVRKAYVLALKKLGYKPSETEEKIKYLFGFRDFDEMKNLGLACEDFLIANLNNNNEDSRTRREVIRVLGAIKSKKAVNPLLEYLNDRDYLIRAKTAWALGEIGDENAVKNLINAFIDKHEEVQRSVIDALGKIDCEDRGAFLQKVFNEEKKFQKQIVETLNESNEEKALEFFALALKTNSITPDDSIYEVFIKKGKKVENILIDIIKNPTYKFKEDLIKALGNMESKKAVETLIELLDDKDWRTRSSSGEALGKIKDERAVESLLDSNLEVEYEVRVEALGKIGGEKATDYLIKEVEEKSSYTGNFALAALWKIKSKKAKDFVLEVLEDDSTDFYMKWRVFAEMGDKIALSELDRELDNAVLNYSYETYEVIIEALTKIGAPAISILSDELNRKDSYQRQKTVIALGKIGDPSTVDVLIKALKDKSYQVENEAAKALINIGKPSVEPLIKITKSKRDYLKERAAITLSKIGDERALNPISELLYDKRDNVRNSAIEALAAYGKSSVPYFLEFLKAEKNNAGMYSTMHSIIYTLGDIGDERAVDALTKLLWVDDREDKRNAFRAIQNISEKTEQPIIGDILKQVLDSNDMVLIYHTLRLNLNYSVDDPDATPYFIHLLRLPSLGTYFPLNNPSDIDMFGDHGAAGEALAEIGKPAVKWLGKVLEDKSEIAGEEAIKALGEIKGSEAEKYLIAALEDKDEELRALARKTLEKIGTPGARKALRKRK